MIKDGNRLNAVFAFFVLKYNEFLYLLYLVSNDFSDNIFIALYFCKGIVSMEEGINGMAGKRRNRRAKIHRRIF